MPTLKLTCNQCGASLEVPEETRFLTALPAPLSLRSIAPVARPMPKSWKLLNLSGWSLNLRSSIGNGWKRLKSTTVQFPG